MELYVTVAILTVLVFVGVWAFKKWPSLREKGPLFVRLGESVAFTMDYWGVSRAYTKKAYTGVQLSALLYSLSSQDLEPAKEKEVVSTFVAISYAQLSEEEDTEEAQRLAAAGYMLLKSHDELLKTVCALWDHPRMDVRKTTLLCIDVLGELFDLKDEFTQEYFQLLIYSINKTLLIFRDEGTGRRSVKKISSTLFRIYKITRAYKHLRSSGGMTEEEFHASISGAFTRLFG
jgi:hypothetical protein